MKKMLAMSLFMLATLSWASAQQPGNMPQGSGGQSTSPNTQMPGAQQTPPSQQPGIPGQSTPQGGTQSGPMGPDAQVTEGCLGGTNPNFTITDAGGTTYKLNIPAGANTAPLTAHLGESVLVMGSVNKAAASTPASIDATRIAKGTGKCPAGSSGAKQPPRQ